MGFHSLGGLMPKSLQHMNAAAKGQLVSARVMYLAGDILGKIWPPEQASYVRVASFLNGKLCFEATMGVAVQALKAQAMSIQNAINREIGSKVVQVVEVRLGRGAA